MDFDFTQAEAGLSQGGARLARGEPARRAAGAAFAASRADVEEVRRLRTWQRTMYEAGYVGMDWPREFGGRGASIVEQVILYQEMARGGVARSRQPRRRLACSGPTLMKHGTPAQQRRFLRPDPHRGRDLVPGILRAERRLAISRISRRARCCDGDDFVRQRPEGVDEHGARRRLVLPARAHRSRARPSTRASASCSST